jgi:hypothetical protein
MAMKTKLLVVDLVDKAYDTMIDNLNSADNGTLENISNAFAAEEHIYGRGQRTGKDG